MSYDHQRGVLIKISELINDEHIEVCDVFEILAFMMGSTVAQMLESGEGVEDKINELADFACIAVRASAYLHVGLVPPSPAETADGETAH